MEHQNHNETKEVQQNLKEQFQELGKNAEAPEELKKEIFNTLDTLALFGDIMDLFTVKFVESELNMIDGITDD